MTFFFFKEKTSDRKTQKQTVSCKSSVLWRQDGCQFDTSKVSRQLSFCASFEGPWKAKRSSKAKEAIRLLLRFRSFCPWKDVEKRFKEFQTYRSTWDIADGNGTKCDSYQLSVNCWHRQNRAKASRQSSPLVDDPSRRLHPLWAKGRCNELSKTNWESFSRSFVRLISRCVF